MPDYSLGKIYCIRSYQTDKIYIGSTCQKYLSTRFQYHKLITNTTNSKTIIDYGDAYIELLENFPCASKQELHKREGELIRIHKNNCVNRCIAGRTNKQYREDNKEAINEHKKQITIENIQQLKELNIQRREKEKIKNNVRQFYQRYYKDKPSGGVAPIISRLY